MSYRYLLHGLRVASEIQLPEPPQLFDGPVDLTFRLTDRGEVGRVPDESIAIRYGFDAETAHYEGFRDPSAGWVIRAPGLAGVTVRDACATLQLAPATDAALVPIIAGGLGMSFFLTISGHLCLHASAVEVDGRALAISAPSGRGKSTLAALAAAAGYPLVGDDLLRVGFGSGAPDVYRGASEIRLRPGVAALTRHWPDRSRITADGRTAVAPPRTHAERLPLAALVFPVLDRERSEVVVERLRPSEAFSSLLGAPRLLGWRDPTVLGREFEQLSGLAAGVPMLVARVPWSTPADPEIGIAVVERALAAA